MGEFDDGALMKAFGQAGAGFFPGPAALADEIHSRYNTPCIGRVEEIHESFWAITAERRISHPAIMTVIESARTALSPDLTPQDPKISANSIGAPHAKQ
jgi:LysR family transcriptional activator of nhaA